MKEYEYADGTPTSTAVETAFTYDSTHPDRLNSCGSTSISYNSIGYPTAYNGYTATCKRGRSIVTPPGEQTQQKIKLAV